MTVFNLDSQILKFWIFEVYFSGKNSLFTSYSNLWKVCTRPTSVSNFFKLDAYHDGLYGPCWTIKKTIPTLKTKFSCEEAVKLLKCKIFEYIVHRKKLASVGVFVVVTKSTGTASTVSASGNFSARTATQIKLLVCRNHCISLGVFLYEIWKSICCWNLETWKLYQ
jgi:hypothetical protein